MQKLFVVQDEEVQNQPNPLSDWKNVEEYSNIQLFFSNNLEHDRAPEDFNSWWSEEHSRFTAEDLEDY